MKHTAMKIIGAITLAFTLSSTANAALVERLGGKAFYDDVLDVTWLANGNLAATKSFGVEGKLTNNPGARTWDNANLWITAMNADGGNGYLGFNDWRLPTIIDTGPVGCDFSFSGTDCGYNVQTGSAATTVYSEMASLFYDTLENKAVRDTNGGFRSDGSWGLLNVGPFINLESFYWSNQPYELDQTTVWWFEFGNGFQTPDGKGNQIFILPVRNGDVGDSSVSDVPEPSVLLLLGAAFIGLVGRKCRQT